MCGGNALEAMRCSEHSKPCVLAHALEALCGDLCIKSLRAAEAETGVTGQPRLLGKLQANDISCLTKQK